MARNLLLFTEQHAPSVFELRVLRNHKNLLQRLFASMAVLDNIFGAVLLAFLLLLPGYCLLSAFRETLGEAPAGPKHRGLFGLLLIAQGLGIGLVVFSIFLVIYAQFMI